MICDNCGAIIDPNEEFCPNCGMQLLDMHPKQVKKKPKKKKKNYKKSKSLGFDDTRSVDKPIKQRYISNSHPEEYDYSHYLDEEEYEAYESPNQDYNYNQGYYEDDYKKKSGFDMGSIILLLVVALILGFIVGLFMFSSQSIPQIPGLSS